MSFREELLLGCNQWYLTIMGSVAAAVLLVSEDVPGLFFRAREDRAQIESGQLQEAVVWLDGGSKRVRVPGPYGEGQPKPLTEYRGLPVGGQGSWMAFYLPEGLDFTLDPGRIFNVNQSMEWNEEHGQQYRIRYTDHFFFAVSVEPVN